RPALVPAQLAAADVAARAGARLGHQPRLAQAGLADDGDEAALAAAQARHPLPQLAQLALAADDRRHQALDAAAPRAARDGCDDLVHLHRVEQAPDLARAQR